MRNAQNDLRIYALRLSRLGYIRAVTDRVMPGAVRAANYRCAAEVEIRGLGVTNRIATIITFQLNQLHVFSNLFGQGAGVPAQILSTKSTTAIKTRLRNPRAGAQLLL